LHDDARGIAAALQARGVWPGVHVALLGPTSRALVTAIQATWLAGGTLVCLPLPMRLGSIEEFVQQTRRRILNAEAGLVVVDPELEPFLAVEPGDPPVVRLDELRGAVGAWERPLDDPERLAIIQFTSGSTADPKGVMLPHRCVVDNIDAIVEGAALSSDDVGVSWLPLYHDMGLIGLLLTPMLTGFDLGLAPPQDFLSSPGDWMRWVADQRATITGGPNFSYALAARALRRLDGLDLSAWRIALNGAEPIDPASVESFVEAGAAHGLDPDAAFCVYGMAEATLAISFPEPGTGMTVDAVDRPTLEHERYAASASPSADARRLPFLGRTLRGLELRVCDPDTGAVLGDREVGELELRGTSVTPGYFRREDVTTATLRDGWLRTGDLGYLVAGEVAVCGRIKDVIIIGGRNVYPEEVERAAAHVDGVRPGNVIAFGTEGRRGKEGIIVVAETRGAASGAVHDDVIDHVCDAVGIPPLEVVLVEAGSLPKTSSGKLQRSICKTQYGEDQLSRA
ncbi:MAG: AMP-binding protein, partial [Acidimicrobiia bacterium]|nr:AMP-binding protein [Acidimicrobiia bacterium]